MYLLGILCLVVATAALPVLPDPPTLSNSVAPAHQDSKIHTYIHNAATASTPLHYRLTDNEDNEEVKKDMLKIASVVSPPLRQLHHSDCSILKKLKAGQIQTSEYSAKKAIANYNEQKKTVILDLEKPVKIEVLPNTLADSVAALPVSKKCMNILKVATDAALEEEKKDNEEIEMNRVKIASTVIPTPPELPPFDYSILRKQKADLNLKSEYCAKQAAKKYKAEKETVFLGLEKPVKVEVPPNPPTLTNSLAALPVSKKCMKILNVATHAALEEERKDNEEVEMNRVKIASFDIPSPPELPPFDYSILRKQKADLNLKSEYCAKQAAKKYKAEKETVFLDSEKPVKVEVPPNPPTLTDSLAALPVSKKCMNILKVATDSAPEEERKDNEEVEMNMVKIASTVIPTPPELPPFDYSILRKQKADLNLKSEYCAKQAAKKYKAEKETVFLDLEKPVKFEVPPNPPTLTDSLAALPVSKKCMNILKVATDAAPEEERKDNEEVEMNRVKIASTVIPTPPELPPFDYSILRKQKADLNLKSEYCAKQAAKKYKAEKETVFLDLEKPVKFEVPPNPPTLTDSLAALPVSKKCMNILKVATDAAPEEERKDNEEVEMNRVKIASTVIPTPPELPPFDYSILRKQKADLNLKSEYCAKQAAKKYEVEKEMVFLDLEKPVQAENGKKEKGAFILEKPVEVKVEKPSTNLDTSVNCHRRIQIRRGFQAHGGI